MVGKLGKRPEGGNRISIYWTESRKHRDKNPRGGEDRKRGGDRKGIFGSHLCVSEEVSHFGGVGILKMPAGQKKRPWRRQKRELGGASESHLGREI